MKSYFSRVTNETALVFDDEIITNEHNLVKTFNGHYINIVEK